MRNGPTSCEAAERAGEPVTPPATPDTYSSVSVLPEASGKWPRPVRVAFIAGSALALWGAIFFIVSKI